MKLKQFLKYICVVCMKYFADSAGLCYQNVYFIRILGFIWIYISFIHGLPFQEVSYLNPTPSFDIGGLIKTLQL